MEITRGKIAKAKKVVIYGAEGIGKSTLASKFPDPVFIDTEGSTHSMEVARLPKPSSWAYLLEEIEYVKNNPGVCKTLIIDTLDWAEQMCIEHVCASHGKSGIEDFGYGNGYVYTKEEFGRFLNRLSDLIDLGINVVLTAHAQVRKFELPDEMGAYDRWELKLGKKTSSQTSPLVKEWADMVLFCNYKTIVENVDGKGAQKGKNKARGGRRVMYTTHHNCWDAKNRYGLEEELPLDYEAIRHIIENDVPQVSEVEKPQEFKVSPSEKIEEARVKEEKEPEKVETVETKEEVKEPEKIDPPAEKAREEPEPEGVRKFFSDPARIPKALIDLMEKDNVCEWHIQEAIAARGYFPSGTLIQDLPEAFITGCLIAGWSSVLGIIEEIKKHQEIVFN